MFARVTLFEIDTLRISLDSAEERFKEMVLPAMRKQEGYEGVYLMRTPEGKGLVMSLWISQEAAVAGVESGFYDEQLAKFISLFRAPPGREHYQVVVAEAPGVTAG